MSVISRLVDRVAPERQPPHPLDGYTEEERAALVAGRGLPRRPRYIQPSGVSPVRSDRRGVSTEAARLFDIALKRGGAVELSDVQWPGTTEGDVRALVAELEHFDLGRLHDEITTAGRGKRRVVMLRLREDLVDVRRPAVLLSDWNRWEGVR